MDQLDQQPQRRPPAEPAPPGTTATDEDAVVQQGGPEPTDGMVESEIPPDPGGTQQPKD